MFLPRVLFVIPGPEQGPSMIFAKRLVPALRELGVTVETFYLASRSSPSILLSEWGRFREVERAFKPALVHAQFGTMTGFFTVLASRSPLVVTFRGSDLNPTPSMNSLRTAVGRILSQVAALRARRVICVSNQLRSRLFWKGRYTTVVPTGVDTKLFRPMDLASARRALGWPPDDRVILFNAGRSPEVKRLDLARAAVDALQQRLANARMLVLDGSVEAASIPLLMNACDCLLVTSDWEGSPTVIQEAIACGLPVISVNVGDVRERLAGLVGSRIVARRASDLAQALQHAVGTPHQVPSEDRLGEISLHAVAQRTLAVYNDALRGVS